MILGSSILGVPYFVANNNVRNTITIAGQTGTLSVPNANQVQTGVTFGPDNSGATVGTFSGSGSGGVVFPLGG